MPQLLLIKIAVFVATVGYGITFPLLAIRLEDMGVSGKLIGLNGAMPALGWILGAVVFPALQARFGIKRVLLAFLLVGVAALAALSQSADYISATALRFFFGGGVGVFFRGIEYLINAISADNVRGRNLGIYNVVFMAGIVIGSVLQPMLGADAASAFGPPLGAFLIASIVIAALPRFQEPEAGTSAMPVSWRAIAIAPAAFLAVLAYGLYEDIAVYLTSVYALRNGLGDAVAAYTLTAASLGNLFLPIPIAMLSDRVHRLIPLLGCAIIVVVASLLIPFTLATPAVFLFALFVWGGSAGALYSIALAIVGDTFKGRELVSANAVFGIIYASGSLIGPMLNGAALDTYNTHGLMLSSAGIFSVLILGIGLAHYFASRRTVT